MARVEYRLSFPIYLTNILPPGPGVPVALPGAFPHNPGLYIILNQNNPQENRYMGISNDLRQRFSERQGVCYDLGFAQAILNGIYAFIGTMRYCSEGDRVWSNPVGYVAGVLNIVLDGYSYDLEHLFIKAVQHTWPYGTITNTRKVGTLYNLGAYPINVDIYWNNGGYHQGVIIPVGGNLI